MWTAYLEFVETDGEIVYRSCTWRGSVSPSNPLNILPSKIRYLAHRIWLEQEDGKVIVAKHRNNDLQGKPADLKEFFIVKLKSAPFIPVGQK